MPVVMGMPILNTGTAEHDQAEFYGVILQGLIKPGVRPQAVHRGDGLLSSRVEARADGAALTAPTGADGQGGADYL